MGQPRHLTPAMPFSLQLYRLATSAAEPLAARWLAARARLGKEDVARLGEKLGRPGQSRPDGPLIWMHGASVGEGLSMAPLAAGLMVQRPDATVLVTTGTRASAEMLRSRLPAAVIHQFAPLDTPAGVSGFLRHWRPDLGVFVESELWPNLVLGARTSGARLALISARMSNASFHNWRRVPGGARAVLRAFDLLLARDEASATHFRVLGREPDGVLDLKSGAPPLAVDAAELATLRRHLGARPILLAASTHPGEESLILNRFATFLRRDSRPLLILAPRHPVRGPALEAFVRSEGWTVARRSKNQGPENVEVFIADTLGEMGLWYQLSTLALVGGSLVSGVGGHNPLEPARLGCPFIAGAHVENWPVYSALEAVGGTRCVAVSALDRYFRQTLMGDPALATMSQRAQAFVAARDHDTQSVAGRLAAMLVR